MPLLCVWVHTWTCMRVMKTLISEIFTPKYGLDRTSWYIKSVWNRLLWNPYGQKDIMIQTSITQNCTVLLLRRELTRSLIKFDSHTPMWPTVLVDEVKRKPRNFEAYLCRSLYPTFTTSFYTHIHFITNGYRTLFKDQLDRSKTTCFFKDTGHYL